MNLESAKAFLQKALSFIQKHKKQCILVILCLWQILNLLLMLFLPAFELTKEIEMKKNLVTGETDYHMRDITISFVLTLILGIFPIIAIVIAVIVLTIYGLRIMMKKKQDLPIATSILKMPSAMILVLLLSFLLTYFMYFLQISSCFEEGAICRITGGGAFIIFSLLASFAVFNILSMRIRKENGKKALERIIERKRALREQVVAVAVEETGREENIQ